ncbi:DNA topoisomerase I [Thermoplasmatales archaeon ex4572_165]|nr:MAG: DNA topoisomerase I [Thermoplasmatales archaeon ex4572_165]
MKLVICEKNIAARKISAILSDGKSKQKNVGTIPVYEFEQDGEPWKIIGLKGHILNTDYPKAYNVWWNIAPRKLIDIPPEKKISERGIAKALQSLVEKNPFVIVATDFDREGELIGVEVIEYLKKKNKFSDIKRAKFSAFTKTEIFDAFNNFTELDYNLSSAGESRQLIDLIWGVVLTRFISLTANKTGKEYLSIGRVQSPTLALLVQKEKEILAFKSKPFWTLTAQLHKELLFDAKHEKDKFWDKKEVTDIYERISDASDAVVKNVKKVQNKEIPPPPFSTTTFLQAASYLKISATQAMKLAEELYMDGAVSYPRTDNTVYPKSLDIHEILQKLKKSSFKDDVETVLNHKRNNPVRGKKQTTDHPPIHPVSVPNIELVGPKKKVYELIVRRFLATLTEDAISETIHVSFDIEKEVFKTRGYRLIEPNWKAVYPYIMSKETLLPPLNKNEQINIKKIKMKEDETKPPKRYSQGSLISKMEQLSLGTKSTRHEIINKLFQRKYITLSPLGPTPLAIAVIDSMNDCDVVKSKMTAELEKDMDLIAEGKKTLEETVKESRIMLTKVMDELEKDKQTIKENIKKADDKQNMIGICPLCGKNLLIRKSRRGKRFVGCQGYPSCKNTYPLPQRGVIKKLDETCEVCKAPIVEVLTKGKKPWRICINMDCPTSKTNEKKEDKEQKD